MPIKISLVLPCYNPDVNWIANIPARLHALEQLIPNAKLELILVNDGSLINLSSYLSDLKKNIPNCIVIEYKTNRGKGYALRKGVEEASGDYILYTDIDFPYTDESMISIVNGLETHEVIVGTRGNSYYSHIPRHRALISKLLRLFVKTLLRIPTNDTQGGLKGMQKQVKPTFLKTEINRYLFDLEFICLSAKANHKMLLVPVVLNEATVVRKMNLAVVSKEALNFFKVYTKMVFTNQA